MWPPPPLAAPIQDRIAWSAACHLAEAEALHSDGRTAALLERLRRAVAASHQAMQASGIVGICRHCDEDDGGSCCGAGLENHYDSLLLLINRLLDVPFPEERRAPDACFFLGPRGCLLEARHVICVNYVCRKITGRIPPAGLSRLRDKEGEELEILFLLHEHLSRMLKQ